MKNKCLFKLANGVYIAKRSVPGEFRNRNKWAEAQEIHRLNNFEILDSSVAGLG